MFLHEELFIRSWIDTGYLKSLQTYLAVEVVIPERADRISALLDSAGIEFTSVLLRQPLTLHVLGRLQWAASVRLSASLMEQRRRVLIGHRSWPRGAGVLAKINALVDMVGTFTKLFLRSPLGALLALFPVPKQIVPLIVAITKQLRVSTLELPHKEYRAVILPSAGFEPWMGSAIFSLRSRGIKTILIPDNWDNLTSKNSLAVLPDYLVTLGKASADNLSSYLGIPKSILKPIGIPKFSSLSPKQKGGVNLGVPRILFLGFSVPYLETKTLNSLHGLLRERLTGGFTLVYKPHPARLPRNAREEPILDGIYVVSSKSRYALPELDTDYESFLSSFDAVIAPPTTMVLEFLIAGRAQIVLDLTNDGVHRTSPGPFFENWIHVRDLEALGLLSGKNPWEIAEAVLFALQTTQSVKNLDYVICQEPGNYARNLALLVKDLPPPR